MKLTIEEIGTLILLAITGLYFVLVIPAFIFVYFGMGFVGDQTDDPNIDLLKSLAIVGLPGIVIGSVWKAFVSNSQKPQP